LLRNTFTAGATKKKILKTIVKDILYKNSLRCLFCLEVFCLNEKPIKNVISLSGGKDSTAMLLMMLEKNMPVDLILFCDTGKEFPAMLRHIDKLEKYVEYPIIRLKAEKEYDYYLYQHKAKSKKHSNDIGYGCLFLTGQTDGVPQN
jgi:3'-phosphoadenosine 5'-phosphosulfate sulfotransferase (PAPS reductase)/FAD synthetase